MPDAQTPDPVLAALDRVITWTRRMRRPVGLSASAYTALDTLVFTGPLRVSDLAVREGLTQPGTTALVNRLEADGLARRDADPTDGRASLISVTDLGRARVDAYRGARADLIADRLAGLDDRDRAALLAAVPALLHLTADPSTPSAESSVPESSSAS